ncbi:hypothetical protein F4677DRAFT_177726 [Hypoxylon crocopeplum]|nr:hypothetical protein F4677DRAFT_177726 [Hypoxylon crocopeplum]
MVVARSPVFAQILRDIYVLLRHNPRRTHSHGTCSTPTSVACFSAHLRDSDPLFQCLVEIIKRGWGSLFNKQSDRNLFLTKTPLEKALEHTYCEAVYLGNPQGFKHCIPTVFATARMDSLIRHSESAMRIEVSGETRTNQAQAFNLAKTSRYAGYKVGGLAFQHSDRGINHLVGRRTQLVCCMLTAWVTLKTSHRCCNSSCTGLSASYQESDGLKVFLSQLQEQI